MSHESSEPWRYTDLSTRAATVLVALAVWQGVVLAGVIPRPLFPGPADVASAFEAWARSGELWRDVTASIWRAGVGYGLGATIGVAVGVSTGRNRWCDILISPIVQVLRPMPPVAIIPLVILWAGIGDLAKIGSTAFAVFFPVWVATHSGTRDVPELFIWSARSLGVGRARETYAVVLPAALPTILTGLRTGVAVAFVMVFVTELAGASAGVGYQIAASQLAYRVDRMMAALLVLAVLGALADALQDCVVRWFCPWIRLMESR